MKKKPKTNSGAMEMIRTLRITDLHRLAFLRAIDALPFAVGDYLNALALHERFRGDWDWRRKNREGFERIEDEDQAFIVKLSRNQAEDAEGVIDRTREIGRANFATIALLLEIKRQLSGEAEKQEDDPEPSNHAEAVN